MEELRVYGLGAVGNVPTVVYWLLLCLFCIGLIVIICWKGIKEGLRSCSVLLLLEWLFLILGMAVLFRETNVERTYCLIPFNSYFHIAENSYLLEDVVINLLNVALFIPVGLLLGCGFQNISWKQVILVGLCTSVLIELLQLVFKKGLCEADDVIHNVVGCLIGYGVCLVAIHLFKPSRSKR